jgi:Ala-tRNA(Pro) deacylase
MRRDVVAPRPRPLVLAGRTFPTAGGLAMTNLIDYLADAKIDHERLPHTRTETAHQEAVAVGVADAEVAKTIVLTTGDGFVRAVLPASERLDLGKAQACLGGKRPRLATETELVGAYPMFELGAVAPFGGPAHDRVLLDTRLARRESVVLEAGSHDESVRLGTPQLVELTRAEVCDICEDREGVIRQ